jgi:hypothetical protein
MRERQSKTLQHSSWGGNSIGFMLFPVEPAARLMDPLVLDQH